MKKVLSLFVVTILFYSCSKNSNQEIDKIKEDISIYQEDLRIKDIQIEQLKEKITLLESKLIEQKKTYSSYLFDLGHSFPLENNPFVDSKLYESITEKPPVTNFTISNPKYEIISQDNIPKSIFEKYLKIVGVYENKEYFSKNIVYTKFYKVKEKDYNWGSGFSFGKQDVTVSYDNLNNTFIYSDGYEASDKNIGFVTSDYFMTNGPSIEKPVFLDVYSEKKEKNKEKQGQYSQIPIEQIKFISFINDFFGKLILKEFDSITNYFYSEKGYLHGEIDSKLIGKDNIFFTKEEVEKDLSLSNSKILTSLEYFSDCIDYHKNDIGTVIQNGFYSEDIDSVYNYFGDDVYLYEVIIDTENYISIIVSIEDNKIYICNINIDLDMQ